MRSSTFSLLPSLSRMRLGPFTQTVLLLLGSQLICLVLGLWIHHRFIGIYAQWSAEQRLWAELDSLLRDAPASLRAAELNQLTPPPNCELILADAGRNVLATRGADSDAWRVGQRLAWRTVNDATGAGRVELQTSAGPRTAGLRGIAAGGAALLAYPLKSPTPSVETLLAALPAAAGVALAWIGSLQCVVGYLVFCRLRNAHAKAQAKSDAEALRRTKDLVRTRDAIIFGLAKLAESRDIDTGHHLERISLYSTRLADALRRTPAYRTRITPAFVKLIGISSALHDIGKVGVKDAILLKKGKLTEIERAHIQTHTTIGGHCLQTIERRLGASNFLEMAREIALHHHEWWNGEGYPTGLAGEQIPLAARIVAIADVYDALSVRRVYREPLPHEACVAYIREQAGTQFDPALVEVFLKIEAQFREIGGKYAAAQEALTQGGASSRQNSLENPAPRETLSPAETHADASVLTLSGAGA